MVEFSIQTVGEERFVRGFNRYVEDVKDFSEAFELIYKDFQAIEAKQFDSEGSRGGEKWKALSPSYAKWKARNHPGRPILILSGALRRSLTEGTGESGNAVKVIDGPRRFARFGTMDPLAEIHQGGTNRMPARKVVSLTEADKIGWARIVQTWAHAKLEKLVASI